VIAGVPTGRVVVQVAVVLSGVAEHPAIATPAALKVIEPGGVPYDAEVVAVKVTDSPDSAGL
jgi:hypothetical protein